MLRSNSHFWRLGLTIWSAAFQFYNLIRTGWSTLGDNGIKGVTALMSGDAWGTAAEYAKAIKGDPMSPRVRRLVLLGTAYAISRSPAL